MHVLWLCIVVEQGAMIAHHVTVTSIATAYTMEVSEGKAGRLMAVLGSLQLAHQFCDLVELAVFD